VPLRRLRQIQLAEHVVSLTEKFLVVDE
jgi:hypothetical protein